MKIPHSPRNGLLFLFLTLLLAIIYINNPAQAVSTYPSAPLSVDDTALAGGIRVTWSAPTDVATGITGYVIEKSTTGLSGSWSQVATVGSSTNSYDIGGLTTVATYVRVGATATAGTGTYGYPWTKIYGTRNAKRGVGQTQTYESGYGITAGDFAPSNTGLSFSRIRYRLDTTISSVAKYAEADSYKWSRAVSTDYSADSSWDPSVTSLMIPTPNSPYQYLVQANVTDLNVYSDNTNVTNGKGMSGRLEIWPWNYGTNVSGVTPAGSGTTYDYDDLPSVASGYYGSFQVHDMTNAKPVFVWNNLDYNSAYTEQVAYGLNSGTNPDWTHCSIGGAYGSCPAPSAFRLQIFINPPITPLTGTSTTTISVPTTGYKGIAMNVTATSNVSGFYSFTWRGKKITGCIKRATPATSPYSVTCSWKPAVQGTQTITATFSNSALGYTSSSASSNTFISKRTSTR